MTHHCGDQPQVPAIILIPVGNEWLPVLYPYNRRMRLHACRNRNQEMACNLANRLLTKMSAWAKHGLKQLYGPDIIRPVPAPGPSVYADWPDELFEDVTETGAP